MLHLDGAFEPSVAVRHVELEQNLPANEVVGHCRGHGHDEEPGQGGVGGGEPLHVLLRREHSSRTFLRIHGVVGEVLGDLDVAVVKVRLLLLLDIADGSMVEHTGVFVTEGKVGQLRSVIGSLGWIVGGCRPDINLGVSQGQSVVNKATLRGFKLVNQALGQAKVLKSEGTYFDSKALYWDTAIVVAVTDANFAKILFSNLMSRGNHT